MNPFVYENFSSDMLDAVRDFIGSTNFKIECVEDSSIILTDGTCILRFYLDGASMVSTIARGNVEFEKSMYIFFKENGIGDKYPFDEKDIFSYREWNKFKVKTILDILSADLEKYMNVMK